MVTINKGYTFTTGLLDDVTNTHLHQLVDSATVTNLVLTEFATSAHLIQKSATTPVSDQGDGSLWYDTTLGLLRDKNGNVAWDAQNTGPEMLYVASNYIRPGEWVTVTADRTVAMCATGMWPEVLGVCVSTIASGSRGLIGSKGPWPARLVGPVTMGDTLISSGHGVFAWADGTARTLHATGISTATLGIALGQALGSLASGVTGLVTCMIWR